MNSQASFYVPWMGLAAAPPAPQPNSGSAGLQQVPVYTTAPTQINSEQQSTAQQQHKIMAFQGQSANQTLLAQMAAAQQYAAAAAAAMPGAAYLYAPSTLGMAASPGALLQACAFLPAPGQQAYMGHSAPHTVASPQQANANLPKFLFPAGTKVSLIATLFRNASHMRPLKRCKKRPGGNHYDIEHATVIRGAAFFTK
jgi:hypothetical protein